MWWREREREKERWRMWWRERERDTEVSREINKLILKFQESS